MALREEIDCSSMFDEIVGSSQALRKVLAQAAKVAPVDSTVLILGETGTGKELIALAIHKRSKRSGRAFIRVDCAASLLVNRSELFGREKALSRARCKGIWGGLSWPTVERSSWTRSANCRPRRRAPYCAYSKSGSLNASVAANPFP